MVFALRHWRVFSLAAVAAMGAYALREEAAAGPARAAMAVDAGEVRSLCATHGYDERVFLERLRAMGAAAVVLRVEPLGRHLESGRVLRFTDEEIAKLRVTGAARLDAPLRPGALWIRDRELADRLDAAAAAEGLDLGLRRYEGMFVADLPAGVEPRTFSTGYDLTLTKAVAEFGLTPLFAADRPADILLALDAGETGGILLSGGAAAAGGDFDAVADRLASGAGWLGFSDSLDRKSRAQALARYPGALDRVFKLVSARSGGGSGEHLRAAVGFGGAVVLSRLDLSAGIEENLSALRSILRPLRARGFELDLAGEPRARRAGPMESWLRALGSLVLILLGPLAALRAGVSLLRKLKQRAPLAKASPFLEAFLSTGAAVGAAAGLGLAAHSLAATHAWRLGAAPLASGSWTAALTVLLVFLALYAQEPQELKLILRRPVLRVSSVLTALPPALAALLVEPPTWLQAPQRAAAQLGVWQPQLWWLQERWREIIVGIPCLLIGMVVFHARLSQEKGKRAEAIDPRGWILLGSFAVIGGVDAFLRGGSAAAGLGQLAWVILSGAAAGLLLLTLRLPGSGGKFSRAETV